MLIVLRCVEGCRGRVLGGVVVCDLGLFCRGVCREGLVAIFCVLCVGGFLFRRLLFVVTNCLFEFLCVYHFLWVYGESGLGLCR